MRLPLKDIVVDVHVSNSRRYRCNGSPVAVAADTMTTIAISHSVRRAGLEIERFPKLIDSVFVDHMTIS